MKNKFLRILHRINGNSNIENRLDIISSNLIKLSEHLEFINKSIHFNSILSPFHFGINAPLYLLQNGRVAFKPEQGNSSNRVFVLSIPKSGTYLLASILEKACLVNTCIHMWENGFHDYRNKTIPEMVHRYKEFAVNMPLIEGLKLVLPGQFCVGHLSYSTENIAALKAFKIFLTIRNIRDVLISFMRWFSNEGRGEQHGKEWKAIPCKKDRMYHFLNLFIQELMEWVKGIVGWMDHHEIEVLKYEDLMGDYGHDKQVAAYKRILNYIGIESHCKTPEIIINNTINKPTKTWSGKRSDQIEYWSDRCEDIFLKFDGAKFNQFLGYT